MNALIVTFYGYKGGTGRTLALSNVARFLAGNLGYRVGLVDLDLESPGLVHEPLCPSLDPDFKGRHELLNKIDEQRGFVECYLDRVNNVERAGEISDYLFGLSNGGNGSIVLMPAARGSVTKSAAYTGQINRFMAALSPNSLLQHGGAELGTPAAVNLASHVTWTILGDFAEQYQLDFLFVDGRTGTGPFFSPVYMYAVPHLLVLFCGLNDQNIQGSVATLQTLDSAASDEVPVLLVMSPVPTGGPGDLEERLRYFANQLSNARRERASGHKYRYRLPERADHVLPYSDAAAYREVFFQDRYPNSALARAYRKLSLAIANAVIRRKDTELPRVEALSSRRVSTGEPIRVAMELVHKDVLKFPNLPTDIDGRSSEDTSAPWQVLLGLRDNDASILDQLPDILVLPQTHLQTLAARPGGRLLYDLNELRREVGDTYHRALDLEFLDKTYLKWRHWCSDDRALKGLPFSVNAMLLCGDADQLRPICRLYWKDKGHLADDPFFLPSNWDAVVALLEAGIRNGKNREDIFRLVSGNRGYYYDWLNYIASMGGFDLIQSEGRLTQVVALGRTETIEATKKFLHLSRLCGRSETMDKLITAFARRQLAMYVGWTDSFRFRVADGITSVSLTATGEREHLKPEQMPKDIRLGHVPRDMHHSRNTLVDGWLMTFPRKANKKEHLARALAFADRMLDPAEQRLLLSKGFPSPSALVIDEELQALYATRLAGAERDQSPEVMIAVERGRRSFEVFLETMKLAIDSGKWIASPKTKTAIEDLVAETFLRIADDESRVEAELGWLAKKLA